MTDRAAVRNEPLKLGIRENLGQFLLLILIKRVSSAFDKRYRSSLC